MLASFLPLHYPLTMRGGGFYHFPWVFLLSYATILARVHIIIQSQPASRNPFRMITSVWPALYLSLLILLLLLLTPPLHLSYYQRRCQIYKVRATNYATSTSTIDYQRLLESLSPNGVRLHPSQMDKVVTEYTVMTPMDRFLAETCHIGCQSTRPRAIITPSSSCQATQGSNGSGE